jgi:hypothetical protein
MENKDQSAKADRKLLKNLIWKSKDLGFKIEKTRELASPIRENHRKPP